jgi:hypothetical protein
LWIWTRNQYTKPSAGRDLVYYLRYIGAMAHLARIREMSPVVNFKQYLVRMQNILVCNLLIRRFQFPLNDVSLIRIGSSYGGWWVPEFSKESLPSGRVLVSAGLGGDVSFDKEMLSRGFTCIGLDPLMEAIFYSKTELAMFTNFFPVNAGLSDAHGQKIFYAPEVKEHDSWSVNNMHSTDLSNARSFDVLSIKDLERLFPALDKAPYRILKMDIEGGEIPVLEQIILLKINFDFLAVEIDFLSLIPFLSLYKRVQHFLIVWKIMTGLEKIGYSLCKTDNFNFCWIFKGQKMGLVGHPNAKH